MDGRQFLDSARRMAKGHIEADWRTAAGRAYYALFIECRDVLLRWGFTIRRDKAHHVVRLRFTYAAVPELKQIGLQLEQLGRLRTSADYETSLSGQFSNGKAAQQAVKDSEGAITILDQIEADPSRRAAAMAAIQATIIP
jgi:hypothetical protein